jgi:hypothetical protein
MTAIGRGRAFTAMNVIRGTRDVAAIARYLELGVDVRTVTREDLELAFIRGREEAHAQQRLVEPADIATALPGVLARKHHCTGGVGPMADRVFIPAVVRKRPTLSMNRPGKSAMAYYDALAGRPNHFILGSSARNLLAEGTATDD